MSTPRFRLTFCSLLLAVSAAPAVVHAEVDALVREGTALVEKGQGKAAFELLAPKEVERAGDPDFDTAFGIAANQAGEFTRAIFALERVLTTQPQNARAKAELGRALFAVGDSRGARNIFDQTRAQGVPADVAATIDQFIQAIDRVEAESASAWQIYAEATVGHDSNASSGSGSGTFAVPGLPTPIPTPNVKDSALFTQFNVGFSGRHVLAPRWSLIANGSAGMKLNGSGGVRYDNDTFNVGVGVSYREDKNEYTVIAQYDRYDSKGSDRVASGLTAEWTHRLDGFRQFSTYVQSTSLRYIPLSFYDTRRNIIGASYAQAFSNGKIGYVGAYFGEEDPDLSTAPSVGHDVWGLRVGGQMPLNGSMSLFGTAAYEKRDYGGSNYPPFFAFPRDDKQTSLSLGLAWTPMKSLRVTPAFTYINNDSNVAPFNYDRSIVSVTVRKQF